MRNMLTSDEGFTIQELLVAIVVGSILVGFGFSLYLFVARIVQKDLQRTEHRAHALRTVELIASDIERSSSLAQLTDSTADLLTAYGRSTLYCVRQGVLLRNGLRLGPSEGEHWSLHFQSSSPGRVLIFLKTSWGMDSLEARAEVHMPQSSKGKFTAKEPEGRDLPSPQGISPVEQ